MKTLVLGASNLERRYSNKAVRSLLEKGHEVVPVGKRKGNIEHLAIQQEFPEGEENIDTVTLYLNAQNQEEYIDRILKLDPRRIIFNPGAENPKLAEKAKAKGIETYNACTLVMLSTGEF